MYPMDTMGYGPKKYRPPLSPNFYQHDLYARPSTLRPQIKRLRPCTGLVRHKGLRTIVCHHLGEDNVRDRWLYVLSKAYNKSEYRFAGGGSPEAGAGRGGLCSAALVTGALLAAVAVLAVASLAFYMGALKPDNGEPMMSFEGSMRVVKGDVYGGPPGSASWKERARRYGAALKQIFTVPSPLKQAFAGALVTGFGDRRLDVHFRLYLDRRKIPSTISNIEETLKDILVQDLRSIRSAFGQVKIDPSSITIKRDLEHTYHSESYVKEAMNESAVINSPKHVVSQNPKDKILQTRVGVVRKTTIKPNQGTKKRVSSADEPDIDEEQLPVVQGSFQITKTEADITENKQNEGSNRQDEKHSHKLKTTTKVPTTRKAPTTSPKPKPFTIMSTLNVKQHTDAPSKKVTGTTTSKSIKPAITSTTTLSTTTLTTSTSEALNTNISQILLDLLSQENHYKDVPKIDSLFTVPHVIDNEPWRPITRPYDFHTTMKPTEHSTEQNAEDRIGVAEVVDDISALESILSAPPPPPAYNEKLKYNPVGIHTVDPNLQAEIYIPKPVYTSFTVPTFAPTLKDTETLGLTYPKPHPIPVDKISSVVEDISHENLNDDDDGKPVERPPKDKTTSVSINVMKINYQEENTTKISVEGASIIKKTNNTKSSFSDNTSSTIQTYTEVESTSAGTTAIQTTKRPNDKVSVIPSTETPYHTWELINSSTIANNSITKSSPEKFYNDTLQAIITRNEAINSNTTHKFPGRLSLLKNLTDIIKRYTINTSEKSPTTNSQRNNETNEGYTDVQDSMEMTGDNFDTFKREDGTESTTSAKVITLLPAKSNLGMNRPLRPRPIIKGEQSDNGTTEDFLELELNQENIKGVEISMKDITTGNISNTITTSTTKSLKENDEILLANNFTNNIKLFGNKHSSSVLSGNRLPKTNLNVNKPTEINNSFVINTSNDNVVSANIPEGTYRISYHVTGSISSKRANKTKSLPAYELALEPDVVLEIPINQSNPLTVDKLRQLANLATISDSDNKTSHRPGGVISTKAIPSSYTLNQAGFKILTKTYNKLQSLKQSDNDLEKNHLEKPSEKPFYELNHDEEKDNMSDAVTKEVQGCDNTTSFRCPEGTCIALTARCNRLLDCARGEDERDCSCADYLRADYSHSKICDGVVDCWDYSDEKHCDWCGEDRYVCANARQCVEAARVCDGTPDCPLGDDEKSCVALADRLDSDIINYNEEGYVMVRKRGVWGRLCVDSFRDAVTRARSSLSLDDLGRAVCRAMTFENSLWSREAREGRQSSEAGYWEVWHNAAARAVDTQLTFRRAACPRRRALRVRCQHLECGIRPHADSQQPRVVGGGGSAAGAWPWQAALYRDGDFQCGGTLITRSWLLSASHCFYEATDAHWVARLGSLRRGAWPRGPWEAASRVRQVVLHPRYEKSGFHNDIALLRVDPLPLHARLRPACLPPARAQPPAGHHCTVVGWGQLYEHERVFPDTLQEVELPVISTAECRRRTRLLPLYLITDNMFCAGYERGGRDACLGDSGGPLMCQESDNRWYIYGVTSNGYGCARANRPGVYTKVSNYIEWIDGVLAAHTPRNSSMNIEFEDLFPEGELLEAAENGRTTRFDKCKGHRCPLGECLPASSVCNGFLECSDGSDERNCHKTSSNSSGTLDPD